MDCLEQKPCPYVVSTAFDDGEGVLVNLNTKQYFRLNQTAMFVWHRIQKGQHAGDIASDMTDEYEVSPAQALESVQRFLWSLSASKLVL